MKPPPFDYLAPDTLEEALAALAEHGSDAKILAGGQSLIPLLNFRLAAPGVLVDLNRVESLDYVKAAGDGGLKIGGMTRQRRLEREPLVAERAPLLAETVPWIAHPQIRNRGTVGGSIAHADPASELPVFAVARRARLKLASSSGERTVDAGDFFVGLMTTDLKEDEILVEIEVPPLPPRTGFAFLEFARRHGDYALLGLAAVLTLDESGGCADARLVYLSAGEKPVEAAGAQALLASDGLAPEKLREAAAHAAEKEIDPSGDIHASEAYKRHLAKVLTVRALERAHQRARAAAGGTA